MKINKFISVSVLAIALFCAQLYASNEKAKNLLKEIETRSKKIDNITKEENKVLTKELNTTMRKIKHTDTKMYNKLKVAAQNLLVERYDKIKNLKNGIRWILYESPVSEKGLWIFEDIKKKAKEIKVDQKQKDFWQLIYGNVADMIREIRIIEEKIKNYSIIPEKNRLTHIVKQLDLLPDFIEKLNKTKIFSYEKETGGLPKEEAKSILEVINAIYETTIDDILKNLLLYIFDQIKKTKLSEQNIHRQFNIFIDSLKTIRKKEKNNELRKKYTKIIKIIDKPNKKIKPKQKDFKNLIYGDISNIINEIRIIKENIRKSPVINGKRFASVLDKKQIEFFVNQLKNLLKPIKKFNTINFLKYQPDAGVTIELIKNIYEMFLEKILDTLNILLQIQIETMKLENKERQKKLDIEKLTSSFIEPLKKLREKEKNNEIKKLNTEIIEFLEKEALQFYNIEDFF